MNQAHAGDWNHSNYIQVEPMIIITVHGEWDDIKSLRKFIGHKYHVAVISKASTYEPPYFDNSEKWLLYKN